MVAKEVGRNLAEDYPELTWRVDLDDAIDLVRAGSVWYTVGGSYIVKALSIYDDGRTPRHIEPANVYIMAGGSYHCDCQDYQNGVAGFSTNHPPRLLLEPGKPSICCCHVLAVHIARMVEASND